LKQTAEGCAEKQKNRESLIEPLPRMEKLGHVSQLRHERGKQVRKRGVKRGEHSQQKKNCISSRDNEGVKTNTNTRKTNVLTEEDGKMKRITSKKKPSNPSRKKKVSARVKNKTLILRITVTLIGKDGWQRNT